MKNWQKLTSWFPLFLISSLSLFFELAIIRWVSGEVRLFSYFKNFPLLAAFLGLAIGFALVGKGRDYRHSFAPIFLMLVVLVLIAGRLSSRQLIYPAQSDDFLWYSASYPYWISLFLFLGFVLVFFLLIMFLFIPLGQATGEEMAKHDPIPAYVCNILASLIGIWIFALISYLQTPPIIWFSLVIVSIGPYFAYRKVKSRFTIPLLLAIFAGVLLSGRGTIWSPYHRLDFSELYLDNPRTGESVNIGYTLKVQQVFYQRAIDLSEDFLNELEDDIPELKNIAFSYNLPYQLVPEGSRVLIVGAGMGNDAASALRNGIAHIDAVDIDPTILALGRELHPEQPYDNPRVMTIVDDARSFFNDSHQRYDAIVFGLLDSHTLLSGLSNVRLDSFVYTVESFKQVQRHLNNEGITVVTFATSAPWIEERLGRMLAIVFGSENVFVHQGEVGTTFVAGTISPDLLTDAQIISWKPNSTFDTLPMATDNWPYLYLRARIIPPAYWQALLLIGIAYLLIVKHAFPEAMRPNWNFWLLGAAFLLIEFKSITELALLFGTTWLVNALAISGVLIMVLAANILVLLRSNINLPLVYTLLFISLLLIFIFPLDRLSELAAISRLLGSTLLLSLPLFFSGIIFSESLRRAGETSRPLASNLSGTMAGGVLEYGSLLWGIQSLYLIAMVLYIGALIASLVQKETTP